MSEWWTYSLSDFLMFSARSYWRLTELYNRDVWPAQLVALAAGVGIGLGVGALGGGAGEGQPSSSIVAQLQPIGRSTRRAAAPSPRRRTRASARWRCASPAFPTPRAPTTSRCG